MYVDGDLYFVQIIDHELPQLLDFPKEVPHLHDASRLCNIQCFPFLYLFGEHLNSHSIHG